MVLLGSVCGSENSCGPLSFSSSWVEVVLPLVSRSSESSTCASYQTAPGHDNGFSLDKSLCLHKTQLRRERKEELVIPIMIGNLPSYFAACRDNAYINRLDLAV